MLVVSYTSVPGTQIMPSASCYRYFSVLPEDTLVFWVAVRQASYDLWNLGEKYAQLFAHAPRWEQP